MRAVIQRVKRAEVRVSNEVVSKIDQGVLTLLGIAKGDQAEQVDKLMRKITDLRIFSDPTGKLNLSLKDIQGSHLIVSQFTLLGDCSQGRRPSFMGAELPERAKELYDRAIAVSKDLGVPTAGGIFQAEMQIELVNDGPATFLIEV